MAKNTLTDKAAIQGRMAAIERELVKKKQLMLEYKRCRLIEFFKPYKWQVEARELIARNTITIIPAPNKIGKCLCIGSRVGTPTGDIEIGELYKIGKPFKVYAWNGKERVIAQASPVFKKEGLHKCYRITMSDGRWIEAADKHRILTNRGWMFVEDFYLNYISWQGRHNISESTSESFQSTHASDGRHSIGKQSNYPDDYLVDYRQYDGKLPVGVGSVLACFPSQVGALRHNYPLFGRGGLVRRYIDSLSLSLHRLSSLRALLHSLSRHVASLFRTAYIGRLSSFSECQASLPLSNAASFVPQPSLEVHPHALHISGFAQTYPSYPLTIQGDQDCHNPYMSPSIKSEKIKAILPERNSIVSITPIGVKEVFDFEVKKYHNYFAGGMIHHNTAMSLCTMFSWLLGYEPWHKVSEDYPGAVRDGKEFYRPSSLGIKPPVRIRLTGEDWDSHFGTSLVPEMNKWMVMPINTNPEDIELGKSVSPWLKSSPKKTKDVPRLFEFKNGSILDLMTYKQDIKLFESWKGDGWIADEPPTQEIFESTSARGLFLSQGKVLMAITPLSNPWILDELVLSGRKDVGVMDGLTILDNEDVVHDDTAVLTGAGLPDAEIQQYLSMLIDYEGKTKAEHLRGIDTFLENAILSKVV